MADDANDELEQRRRPGPKIKFSIAQLEAAIQQYHGNATLAAKMLSQVGVALHGEGHTISRQTIVRAIDKSPRLQKAVENSREEILDLAEDNLVRNLKAGDIHAAKFTLETLGKHRGYIRKYEGQLNAEVNLKVEVHDARNRLYAELDAMDARRRSLASGSYGQARLEGPRRGDEKGEDGPVNADVGLDVLESPVATGTTGQ